MEYIFTGFWLMDMVLCFRTGVYINDVLHFQPKRIAKHYLTSWFWFDSRPQQVARWPLRQFVKPPRTWAC